MLGPRTSRVQINVDCGETFIHKGECQHLVTESLSPRKSDTKLALLYMAAVVNVTRTYDASVLVPSMALLGRWRCQPLFLRGLKQLGNGTFPMKGLDIPGACPQIIFFQTFAGAVIIIIKGVSHPRH